MTLLPPEPVARRAVGDTATRPPLRQEPAVRWLSIAQLLRTATEVVQATIFARFADRREVMASCPQEYYELRPRTRPVWVDFVADTGDGFDATFATARCVAGGPGVAIDAADDPFGHRPERADLLVLGGDEVYPVASPTAYADRLNRVFDAARRPPPQPAPGPELMHSLMPVVGPVGAAPPPPVVALPGNHDWYDGLAAFRRNFCESWVKGRSADDAGAGGLLQVPIEKPDDVGGWGAFQSRSYFAVKLCEGWWLWGIDSQLDAPIDAEQLAYFGEAATRLSFDDDAVILCVATPSWLEAGEGEPAPTAAADTPFGTLVWFVDRVLGERRELVRLVLTGDRHHYARYTSAEPGADSWAPDLVTSGGGGAFLSGTHHLPEALEVAWTPWRPDAPVTGYRLATSYPDAATCWDILRPGLRKPAPAPRSGFLGAAWKNGWGLPALVGLVEFLCLYQPAVAQDWWRFGWLAAVALLLLGAFALSGIRGNNLTGWRRAGAVAGLALAHLAGHAVLPLLLAWVAHLAGLQGAALGWFGGAAFVVFATVGMLVHVTYLRVADLWGFHTLEVFSGLHVQDYKCHLRIRVERDRAVVHVIAIDAVPRMAGRDPAAPPPLRARVLETFDVAHRAPY